MKVVVSLILVLALFASAAPPTYAEPQQVAQGTQLHLTLLTPVNSARSKEGEAFVAVLAEPVAIDSQVILPAGTRLNGVVGNLQKAKFFSMFKGQAYLNLTFKTIEVDSRLIPVQLSLLAIGKPRQDGGTSPIRKDVKITEGEVVQEKHDYKSDIMFVALGGGTGSTIGLIAGNVTKGMGIGYGVGAAYVLIRKGKEVNLPAQTALLARIDSAVTLPTIPSASVTEGSETKGSR